MQTKSLQLNFWAVTAGIFLAVITRLLPHPPNFAPMMALGIFGGALFAKRGWALLVPIAAIFISDLYINNVVYGKFNDHFVWLYGGWYWQYSIYLLVPLISMIVFSKRIGVVKIALMGLSTAVLFFLVSNFGVWAGGNMYPGNFEGLMTCYTMGLPFFKGTITSNLVYSSVLFGAYYLLENNTALFPVTDRHEWKWI